MADNVVKDRQGWTSAPYFIVADVVSTANYYRDKLGFRYERFWKADITHWLVYGSLLLDACASSSVGRYDSTDPRPPAGVHVDERVETWRITAGDVSAVRTTLRLGVPRAGGHGYAGQLRWSLHWDTRSTADSSGCKVVEANVYLQTTMLTPMWAPPAYTKQTVVAEWERFLHALEVHEQGHRRIAVTGATRVWQAIMGVTAPSCELIAGLVQAVAQPLVADLRRAEERYDIDTQHGETQGALFRP